MRKKELLSKSSMLATTDMIMTAQGDIGEKKQYRAVYGHKTEYTQYKTKYYFRARILDKNILEVDIYHRDELKKNIRTPRYHIFIDRDEEKYITYDVRKESWRTARICFLDYEYNNDDYYGTHPKSIAKAAELKLVNDYLNTRKTEIENAVLDYQNRLVNDRLLKSHRRETDQIDYDMNMVPEEPPADFKAWVEKEAFSSSLYLIYKEGKCLCTRCGKFFTANIRNMHNKPGKCKLCHKEGTYKSWGRQKKLVDTKYVSVIQSLEDDEIVYRQYCATRVLDKEKDYNLQCVYSEYYRSILDTDITNERDYYWGEYKNTRVMRWCKAGTFRTGYYYNNIEGYRRSILYPKNLDKVFAHAKIRYIPLTQMFKQIAPKRNDVLGNLKDMSRRPQIYEAFWKMGLRRFCSDLLCSDSIFTKFDFERGDKPWNILKMTKERMNQCIWLDVGDVGIRIAQRLSDLGVRVSDKELIWMEKYLKSSDILRFFRIQTPHKIIRFLQEKTGIEQESEAYKNNVLHEYIDYLDMAFDAGDNLRDESVFFPQDIHNAHEEVAERLREIKEKIENAERKEKDKILRKYAKDIRKIFSYETDEMCIVVPESYSDFKKEANMQHNCVASKYYDRMVEAECIILFIRAKDEKEKAFCTVEVRNEKGQFKVYQNRTKYNNSSPDEAVEFMNEAVKRAQKKIDKMLKNKAVKTRM